MFGLFKKKENRIPVDDCIWMTKEAKWAACAEQCRKDSSTLFVAWFEESKKELESYLAGRQTGGTVLAADFTHGQQMAPVVFVEHFPLQAEEQNKFLDLGLAKATVYSSLDEPLFLTFGGERIADMMRKMGMQPSEMVTHSMVSASIVRAQEKIAAKAIVAVSARSQADWLANAGINHQP